MVVTALAAALPANVFAAHSDSSVSTGGQILSAEQIKEIATNTYEYSFDNAQAMLESELNAGYLDSVNSPGNEYTLYVNRYTGVIYYVNNLTGQILTSNPYNPAYGSPATVSIDRRKQLMSQVSVSFVPTGHSSSDETYYSSTWAAEFGQINVSPLLGGLRVNYTLGDTSTRFLAPGQIRAERFIEYILNPMLEYYKEMLVQYIGEFEETEGVNFDFYGQDSWAYRTKEYPIVLNECINITAVKGYCSETNAIYNRLLPKYSADKKALDGIRGDIMTLLSKYDLKNPIGEPEGSIKLQNMHELAPLTKEGIPVFVSTGDSVSDSKIQATIIRTYCPDYTFQMMYEDESECGYEYEMVQKPVFRCSIEYGFNSDGTLSVRLPATSISFDETAYTLKNISYMMYFGCGDLTTEGYVFLPDGSGTVIDFDDFYNKNSRENVAVDLSIYGNDYCYSMLTGAHLEQVTMPVYGMVSGSVQGQDYADAFGSSSATNGYFAILEEGASLAKIKVRFGGSSSKFANLFASFTPYPSDEYDLSDTISVGASGSYTIVSESKYTGSYVTRFVMLSDPALAGQTNNYSANYVGMASYYRSYLEARGDLTRLTEDEVLSDLPLYIEALGSMEIVEKILTFPVTTSIPLTTFDDISVIYSELADAKNKLAQKAAEYQALADEETKNLDLKQTHLATAKKYTEMANTLDNVTNVNFRLTGFANGGMYFTYPSRVKWERACGGKSGFKNLISNAASLTKDNANFGVYPEFDFQYVSNTAMFDGISVRKNISKMVDNRYASKQEYNSVLGGYESVMALLVSPDSLAGLFAKFDGKYSSYDWKFISASTLGSDLNSNFDEDNPINRQDSVSYVTSLLDTIANEKCYSVMTSKGNMYSVKYADHIVDVCTDASHFRYSSYTVPFTGMVLHGYVNYAGSALNYSGSPDYDMLRAIENGASLYYILCYENTSYMKEDLLLNKYYGVDYANWFDSMVLAYNELNKAIGDYQRYNIVDHSVLIAERVIDAEETIVNKKLLADEFISLVDTQVYDLINATFDSMYESGAAIGTSIKLTVNTEALIAQAVSCLNVDEKELEAIGFTEKLTSIVSSYCAKYAGGEYEVAVSFEAVEYSTKYNYVTDSVATDKNYDHTDYTVDNNMVTIVTYLDPDTQHTVRFILNYNIYSVTVKLADGSVYTIDKYDYVKID